MTRLRFPGYLHNLCGRVGGHPHALILANSRQRDPAELKLYRGFGLLILLVVNRLDRARCTPGQLTGRRQEDLGTCECTESA